MREESRCRVPFPFLLLPRHRKREERSVQLWGQRVRSQVRQDYQRASPEDKRS